MKKLFSRKVLGVIALAMACVILGAGISTTMTASAGSTTGTVPGVTSPFTAAVNLVKDSVVRVDIYKTTTSYGSSYGYGNGNGYNYGYGNSFPWGNFFGGFGNGYGNNYGYGNGNGRNGYGYNTPNTSESYAGHGSGVVVADKYVLTNYHVVEDASSLKINIFNDDTDETTELACSVVATDENNDLAVLYVPDLTLIPVALGDSDTLQVGDYVFTVGTPLEFTNTVTAGIVSGLEREVKNGTTRDAYGRKTDIINTLIQTDAPINSGNSGGGLFITTGELIGIPVMKYVLSSDGTNAESIGLCIPVNTAKSLIEEAMGKQPEAASSDAGTGATKKGNDDTDANSGATRKGHDSGNENPAAEEETATVGTGLVGKPRMGVTVATINGSALANLVPSGAYVSEVEKNSPAELGGVQPYDIIVEANGTVTPDTTTMMDIIGQLKEGDQVTLKVFRTGVDLAGESIDTDALTKGEYVDLTVTLAIIDNIAQ